MRIAHLLILCVATLAPVAAFAFTTDDAKVNGAIKQHQLAVQAYAETRNKPMPVVVDYKYGMTLDIAKVVRRSPDLKLCKVIPQLMTYEDSLGGLNTLQYQVLSDCRNKH